MKTKTLLELERTECRYPIMHDLEVVGHYHFCAKPTLSERAYCKEHHQLCAPANQPRKINLPRKI